MEPSCNYGAELTIGQRLLPFSHRIWQLTTNCRLLILLYLSIYLPTYLSIYLPIDLSIYLSIYLSDLSEISINFMDLPAMQRFLGRYHSQSRALHKSHFRRPFVTLEESFGLAAVNWVSSFLVGGLEHFVCFHIFGIIIPVD